MKQPALVKISYVPPAHGWLPLSLYLRDQLIEIDASDVPNNPIQDLITALEGIARGRDTYAWWNLEPAGYFMYFQRVQDEVQLRIEYEDNSERSRARKVAMVQGTKAEVLLPFWRFLREFESHSFMEPHWPIVDYARVLEIKPLIDADR